MIRTLQKLLAPLRRRLSLIVTRAVLTLVDDARLLQEVQVKLLADEVMDGVERFQEYGFTSVPHAGAEGVALSVGGHRSNTVVIAVDDRRYRLKGLQNGEVALYTDEDQAEHGHRIVLRRGGVIEAHCAHLKLHARQSRTMDVAGYGETLTYVGGTAWHQDTYHDGATVTATEHGIQPPEVE